MYETHFGLSQRPFSQTVNASAYVALPSRDAALRRLRYGLEHGQGPALLFGPPGSGKTLVARRLASQLDITPVHLTFPAMPAAELLCLLAEELGGPPDVEQPTVVSALRRVRERLATLVARGVRPMLVIDEAHLIQDIATYEAIRLLLNIASDGTPDLWLLLVGTAELVLQLPPGLSDRLTARSLLGPLSESETSAYIHGRLAAAGATTPLFSDEAVTALHLAADGLPRRLNNLADLSLLIAYAEEHPRAEARTVAIAAREFYPDPLAA